MKVLIITGAGERQVFSGNLLECLLASKRLQKTINIAVVVESDNKKRLSMADQIPILTRLTR